MPYQSQESQLLQTVYRVLEATVAYATLICTFYYYYYYYYCLTSLDHQIHSRVVPWTKSHLGDRSLTVAHPRLLTLDC